ncbi:Transcription factor PERIANTHIA [Zea mays]|uniref:Transcription factor PERIANTHIA n=1 Tax=Zea mays TaxID=4577 RepID=A0A1D6LWH6_MAIZE|nr:Transcription factor PERIANTHIA [Zea mays]AQK83582.1 Transcription factor PERIANTHIA [Zea mays]AQK83585.1 Transcription factor PERIANTHIA [Zea mays]
MTPWSAAAHFENWGDSGSSSPPARQTAHRRRHGGGGAMAQSVDGHDNSLPACKVEPRDHKCAMPCAEEACAKREAARKSRMRKKCDPPSLTGSFCTYAMLASCIPSCLLLAQYPPAYIVELENSRSKLSHLEQELQRARQQGMFIASALAFDLEYARWLDEHQHHMNDLRVALSAQIGDDDLGVLVDGAMLHYDQMFRLKGVATRTDVFHVLARHVEPLTEQQLVGICGLQQSLQQAEDALSQGMEALQQALGDTLAAAATPCAADSVTNYMGQMAVAMSKLATVENFLRQADLLRQQTLKQVRRILTTRQAARALLVISDYFSRLRALSSLWLTRPTD